MKKIFAIIIVFCLLQICMSAVFAVEVAAGEILIEAENYDAINYGGSINSDPAMSEGKFLELTTTSPPPEEGYYAEYKVNLPESGAYQIDIAISLLNKNYLSPFGISVNGGPVVPAAEGKAQQLNVISSTVNNNVLGVARMIPIGGFVKGENIVRVHITSKRTMDDRFTFFFDYMKLRKMPWGISSVEIKNDTVLGIYEYGMDNEFVIDFYSPAEKQETIYYEVLDFWAEVVRTETIDVKVGESSHSVKLSGLPRGHYFINAGLRGDTAVVSNYFSVVTPLSERKKIEETPFAMDAAISWLVPNDKVVSYSKAEALAGIEWVRERFRWSSSHTSENSYNFETDNVDTAFREMAAEGIKLLPLSSDAPGWLKEDPNDRIPDNILPAYHYAKKSAEHFEGVVQAWEMWNEPDIGPTLNSETSDRLTALMKVFAIGYYDSTANPLVSSPGYAYQPGHYTELAMRNDMMDYVDIYNYHNHLTYNDNVPIMHLQPLGASHINLLYRYGAGDKEVWLTEAGTYVPFRPDKSELDHDQQVKYAKYLVVSTIDSIIQGTDLHFWFVLPYYVEANRMLGIFSQAHTPYSPYNAQATMTEVLGEGKYLGSVNDLPKTASGYIFNTGEGHAAVVYSTEEREVSLSVPGESAQEINIMGGITELTAVDGKVTFTANTEPRYIKISGEFDENIYTKDGRVKNPRPEKTFTPAQRVVLDQRYPREHRTDAKLEGYILPYGDTIVRVDVNNLNDKVMEGVIHGKTFAGWELSPASQSVRVEPFSKKAVTFKVKPTGSALPNTASTVKFTGEFDGEMTSNSVAAVLYEGDERPVMDVVLPGSTDLANWEHNISTNGKSEITAGTKPGEINFKFTFSGTGDKWTYPKLSMPAGTDFRGSKGLLINYKSDVDTTATALCRVIIQEQNGCQYFTNGGFYIEGGESQILIPWTKLSPLGGIDDNFSLDLNLIDTIQIGLNARQDDIPAYTITSVGVYNGAAQDLYPSITEANPFSGEITDDRSPQIRMVISENEIDLIESTIDLAINGRIIDHSFDSATRELTATLPESLSEGDHAIRITYQCEDTKGFNNLINFSVNTKQVNFIDIDNVEWAREAIINLAKAEVINGIGEGLFAPDNNITRAELVTLLAKMFGLDDEVTESGFSDVPQWAWYFDSVAQGQNSGYFNGIYTDNFEPDEYITRQDMAAIAFIALQKAGVQLPKTEKRQTFLDRNSFKSYAVEAITAFQLAGLVEGKGDRRFSPEDNLTRAEAAKIIYGINSFRKK